MITKNMLLPAWTIPALVNSDDSGLNDDQIGLLNKLSRDLNYDGYNGIPCDYQDHGFCNTNDLDGVAGDCYMVIFQALENLDYCPEGFISHTERRPLEWQKQGLQYTASGYGRKIPTELIAHCTDGRQRRIYMRQFSNAGSPFIMYKGKRLFCERALPY